MKCKRCNGGGTVTEPYMLFFKKKVMCIACGGRGKALEPVSRPIRPAPAGGPVSRPAPSRPSEPVRRTDQNYDPFTDPLNPLSPFYILDDVLATPAPQAPTGPPVIVDPFSPPPTQDSCPAPNPTEGTPAEQTTCEAPSDSGSFPDSTGSDSSGTSY